MPPRPAAPLPHSGAAGGVVLMAAALLALLVANSPLAGVHAALLRRPLGPLDLHGWIDDGLMALFFLAVGLEMRRELRTGTLATPAARLLPVMAAVAGMAMPALVFLLIGGGDPALRRGWAIPAATDIAFALGLATLLGPRMPPSLRLLLTAIAVVDDLLAILAIALFYTGMPALFPLAAAMTGFVVLAACNRAGVRSLWVYLPVGAAIWYGVLLSGVHPTLAGVALAFAIPAGGPHAPAERLERGLRPWVAFLILPLFAFANTGLSLGGLRIGDALAPLPLGIALGLFVGKQAGIFGAVFAAVRLTPVAMPAGAGWRHVHAMAALCGIGFTMSLFIGGLAFPGRGDAVRIGVLAGSILSALLACLLLPRAPIPATASPAHPPNRRWSWHRHAGDR